MDIDEAARITRMLMYKHGLMHWRFYFDNALRRFGRCSHTRKTISLSRHLTALNPPEIVINTIKHEIAHALVLPPWTDGTHGPTWKRKALEVGCNGERCYGAHAKLPDNRWVGICPAGHVVERVRRRLLSCSVCCPDRFNENCLFEWKRIP